MKIILLEDVEKLGKKDEVKEVANGYARNFLIPKNLAVAATKTELKKLEQRKELAAKQAEEELKTIQETATQLDGLDLEIPVRVDENKKLFGTITAAKIAEELKKKGFELKKNQIKLEKPIKELGDYETAIELPHNLEVKIKVIVVEEKKNSEQETIHNP